jgi:DNA repair exonuclease SbcCD ATPase subunit
MLEWTQIVATIGVGAAALMAFLWRGAEARAETKDRDNAVLTGSLESIESTLAKEQKLRSRQAEELAEFRKRADKAKRRSAAKGATQPIGTLSRIQDLEEAMGQAERERNRFREERDSLTQELAQLRTLREAEARAAATNAAPVGSPPAEPDERLVLEAGLSQARERIVKLESEQQNARRTEARLRKRMDTQEQLYASLRAELEAKKDRLRTQEEQLQRLQALKVAVID